MNSLTNFFLRYHPDLPDTLDAEHATPLFLLLHRFDFSLSVRLCVQVDLRGTGQCEVFDDKLHHWHPFTHDRTKRAADNSEQFFYSLSWIENPARIRKKFSVLQNRLQISPDFHRALKRPTTHTKSVLFPKG
jgi:hypothetical protein